ncbi:MAG TPA: DinB family protein [Thermoanaerobaculaceae bacterium]|nr:DinB family protein [Thermoanaerobaculaceae bacterium]
MSDVLPWLEYRWSFDFPVGMFRAIVERVRGTPARLEEVVRSAPPKRMTRRPGGKWSAQEHAGHLVSLEALWHVRLDEFRRGAAALTAADMTNKATDSGDYNRRTLAAILADFRAARGGTVAVLDRLSLEAAGHTAVHPRPGRSIRLVDLCYFCAEHDDHHLAMIRNLLAT